jgi:hypothetical protein
MFDEYNSVLDALDREEIDRIIEATTKFIEEIAGPIECSLTEDGCDDG